MVWNRTADVETTKATVGAAKSSTANSASHRISERDRTAAAPGCRPRRRAAGAQPSSNADVAVLWGIGLIELAAILSLLLVSSIRQLTNDVPADTQPGETAVSD
jgi:hypothetical protein